MDEPLSNLDALLRDSMRQQLIAVHKKVGKATVYVTHDQLEAMTMADRIVVMNEGVIQQVGTPQEIFNTPANLFVAGFVGNPHMNMLQGECVGRRKIRIGSTVMGTDASVDEATGTVTVGLRPTDGEISAGNNALHGVVEAVEFIGSDSIATVSVEGAETLQIRFSANNVPEQGAEVCVHFSPANVHVFGRNGERL